MTPPTVLDARYRIDAVLGEGRTAVVYAARDLMLGQAVAIKWPRGPLARASARSRAVREATALRLVRHPGVVQLRAIGDYEGRFYLVLERLDDETLEAALLRAPLEPEPLAVLLRSALHVLEVAHARGIIHRDVKPRNLILPQRRGSAAVKLIDFGSCHIVGLDDPREGTPYYLPPEAAGCFREADARWDVYAAGITLVRALFGPIHLHTLRGLVEQSSADDLSLPAGQRKLLAIARRACARVRDHRFKTAAEFAAALDDYLRGRIGTAFETEPVRSEGEVRSVRYV